MKRLPKKLSDRILVALTDLETCEADPRYTIHMGRFHVPNVITGACSVCLAGSVMAKTLGAAPELYLVPGNFAAHLKNQLRELDTVRCGNGPVKDWFDISESNELTQLCYYDRPEWKLHMLDIVGRLQAEGL